MRYKHAHNFTDALEHKTVYFIPMTDIAIPGILFAIICLIIILLVASVSYFITRFFFSNSVAIILSLSFGIASIALIAMLKEDNEVDSGVNVFEGIYYKHIRKYEEITTSNGKRYYLSGRRKGGVRFV